MFLHFPETINNLDCCFLIPRVVNSPPEAVLLWVRVSDVEVDNKLESGEIIFPNWIIEKLSCVCVSDLEVDEKLKKILTKWMPEKFIMSIFCNSARLNYIPIVMSIVVGHVVLLSVFPVLLCLSSLSSFPPLFVLDKLSQAVPFSPLFLIRWFLTLFCLFLTVFF